MVEKKRCKFSFGGKQYPVSEKFLLYHDTRWRRSELFSTAFGMFNSMSENMIAIQKELVLERTYYG